VVIVGVLVIVDGLEALIGCVCSSPAVVEEVDHMVRSQRWLSDTILAQGSDEGKLVLFDVRRITSPLATMAVPDMGQVQRLDQWQLEEGSVKLTLAGHGAAIVAFDGTSMCGNPEVAFAFQSFSPSSVCVSVSVHLWHRVAEPSLHFKLETVIPCAAPSATALLPIEVESTIRHLQGVGTSTWLVSNSEGFFGTVQ
jgi:hypothetical protein